MPDRQSGAPGGPNPEKGESNAEKSARYFAHLTGWLAAASVIPGRGGRVNISALEVATGIPRQVLYRDEFQAEIQKAAASLGLGMPEQQRAPGAEAVPAWAKQRIKDLEEQVAVLKAEAHDLRARLRRYEHLERHLGETGLLAR